MVINAKPSSGRVFDKWKSTKGITIEDNTSEIAEMNVTAPGNVTAVFEPAVALSMNKSTVSVSPNSSVMDYTNVSGAPQSVKMFFNSDNSGIKVSFGSKKITDNMSGVIDSVETSSKFLSLNRIVSRYHDCDGCGS